MAKRNAKKACVAFHSVKCSFRNAWSLFGKLPRNRKHFIKMFCQKKANSDGKATPLRKKLSKKSASKGIMAPIYQ
jgi:hypothetical protein